MSHLIAHRGHSATTPENTMAAFRAAVEHGFGWIETDADLLSDGMLVLFHDETLDRTTDGSGPVSALAREDLEHLDAGSWFGPEFVGERIPTLDQLVDLLVDSGTELNLELKLSDPTPERVEDFLSGVLEALGRLDEDRTVLVSSFQHDLLAALRDAGSTLPLACLFERHVLEAEHPESWRPALERTGAVAVHPFQGDLDLALMAQFQDAGLVVNTWTVNEPLRREQLAEWGVEGICTDGPAEMLA